MDMAKPELDPRVVLEKYLAVLTGSDDSVVCDVSDLAHSKEDVRVVLQRWLRIATDADQREQLKEAYASLSKFQHINDAEQEALAVLSGMGQIAVEGSKLFDKQKRQITHVAAPLQAIIDRVLAERAVLAQELKSLLGEG
jgi:hypothetical protein